jgi:hypothetical protein
MSRIEVRTAVGNWIAGAGIAHLNQVFSSFPKRINFQANSTAGEVTRAAGVVFIRSESERRIANGGAYSGWKLVDYDIEFQVFTHSVAQYAQDAMTDFDTIIDAIKDRLRDGGHRLGLEAGDIIWQAAEPDISVTYGEPVTNEGSATEIWASINFVVTQTVAI